MDTLYGYEIRDVDGRRVPEGEERTVDIKMLWQSNHEILCLALEGYKQTEIARILNIHPATVSNTLNSTLGKQKLSDMRKERDKEFISVSDKVRILTEKALKVYYELLESDRSSDSMKKEVADTIVLDIAGMRAPTKVDARSIHAYVTSEEIEEFKRRAIQAAKESGQLVEIKVE